MFQDVVKMNEAFGNPKGTAADATSDRFEKQCKNIGDEAVELRNAIDSGDSVAIRDALCDIMVFTLGAFHFIGADADADMKAVFDSNMSKFCKDEEELIATRKKYDALGVRHYAEGEFPARYLKCSEDFTDAAGNQYRKGKFLKSVSFKEPVFLVVP